MVVKSGIIRSLNYFSDGVELFLNKHGNTVISGALGGMGGWLTRIDPKLGFFQGVVGGFVVTWVSRPIYKYVKKNSGTGDDEIHENAKNMLFVSSIVAETAVPIMLTMYLVDPTLKAVASILPTSIKWLVAPAVGKEYTLFHGLKVTFYAAVALLSIEHYRNYHKKI